VTTRQSRSCLVSVYGTGNILAALCAVEWLGRQRGHEGDARVATLVHPPTDSRSAAREIGAAVERLIRPHGWMPPVVLTTDDVNRLLQGSDGGRSHRGQLDRARRLAGREAPDEIYYAHDIVSPIPRLLMEAFPRADRTTFGDALGSTFNAEYRLAQAAGATHQEAVRVAKNAHVPAAGRRPSLLSAFREKRKSSASAPQATHAALILPMDQTGDYLEDKTLVVVPRDVVLEVIAKCRQALPELEDFSRNWLAAHTSPRYLLLLENYSEARMMSFEASVHMYESMVRRVAPRGANVLIKPHPLATDPLARTLCQRLNSEYAACVMPTTLNRYPIELWRTLLEACEVVSTMSYCDVSLMYLYAKRPRQLMDDSLIAEYFPIASQGRLVEARDIYGEMLEALENWDGTSVLWRGDLT